MTRRSASPLQGDDLVVWRRIEAQWKGVKNAPGHDAPEKRALRFLGQILSVERVTPETRDSNAFNRLSPTGYAFLYTEFARELGYRFDSFLPIERKRTLLDLGYCAFKAVRKRTIHGRLASHEWELFAQSRIGAIASSLDRQVTLLDVLDSDLHSTLRFRACKGALAEDWLNPEIKSRLEKLLPAQEHARFPTLPWKSTSGQADTNMALVHAYCPELYAVLTALAPVSAWESRKTMLPLAMQFALGGTQDDTVDLPGDFDTPSA